MDDTKSTPAGGLKRCYRCGESKPPEAFYRDRSKATGLSSGCRPCSILGARESHERNRERVREYQRDYYQKNRDEFRDRHLANTYGITRADYDRMFEEQGSVCAICGVEEKLHVDHCHDSGKVRGLLCTGCNRGIGFLGDDPERLRAAAEYLE